MKVSNSIATILFSYLLSIVAHADLDCADLDQVKGAENGGEKVDHGSGGMTLLRAA